jgi:hypothetical protein
VEVAAFLEPAMLENVFAALSMIALAYAGCGLLEAITV